MICHEWETDNAKMDMGYLNGEGGRFGWFAPTMWFANTTCCTFWWGFYSNNYSIYFKGTQTELDGVPLFQPNSRHNISSSTKNGLNRTLYSSTCVFICSYKSSLTWSKDVLYHHWKISHPCTPSPIHIPYSKLMSNWNPATFQILLLLETLVPLMGTLRLPFPFLLAHIYNPGSLSR